MRTENRLAGLPLLALGLCIVSPNANAEEPNANAREQESGPVIADIVVTAQRRAERLQDVPASIVAVSAEALAKSGVTNTADLARIVPGVGMTFQGGWLQPAIRGITSVGSNIGDNSNVAMYLDGIYQPQQIATLIDLPDVQQIEVLKGPQGALYGQNATGGAILVTTMQPSFTAGGKLSASYGSYNDVQLRGYVTGGLSDTIAASLSGGYQNRNGFRRHVVTHERNRSLDSKVLRGKLLIKPSDTAKITVTGYYSDRIDSNTFTGVPLNNASVGYVFFPDAPKAKGPKQFASDPDNFFHTKSYGGNVRGEFDVGAGTIHTTTALFRNKSNFAHGDADFSPIDYAEAGPSNLTGRFFIQEMNFVSKKAGPVTFLAGAFYLNGEEAWRHNVFQLRSPTLPPSPIIVPPLFSIDSRMRIQKEIFAAYGEMTFDVTERLVLTAGGRYTSERQHGFAQLIPGTVDTPGGPLVERPGGAVTFSKFTPRVTARYAVSAEANIYASWGKGFKSGLIETANLTQPPIDPEVITAYEVGFKGRVADRLTVNAAAFYYDYKGLQFTAYDPPNFVHQNAASARIKGIDLDANWAVTPQLTLSGGVAYLDSKYVKFPNAAVFVPMSPCDTSGCYAQVSVDLSGKRMLRAPKITANFSANYELDTSVGRFGAFTSVYHTSNYGFEASNHFQQDAYTTLDGELSFVPSDLPGIRLVLWGKNLTNKAYFSQSLQSGSAVGMSYADPRTLGVRAEFKF